MMNVLLFPLQPQTPCGGLDAQICSKVSLPRNCLGLLWVPLLSRIPPAWILRRDGVGALLPQGDTSLSLHRAGSWKMRYFNQKAPSSGLLRLLPNVSAGFSMENSSRPSEQGRARGVSPGELWIWHFPHGDHSEPRGKEKTSNPDPCLKTSRSSWAPENPAPAPSQIPFFFPSVGKSESAPKAADNCRQWKIKGIGAGGFIKTTNWSWLKTLICASQVQGMFQKRWIWATAGQDCGGGTGWHLVALGDALSKGLGSVSSLPHGNGFQRWLVPSNLYFLNKYLHFYGKSPGVCAFVLWDWRSWSLGSGAGFGIAPGNPQDGEIPGMGLFLSPITSRNTIRIKYLC